MQIVIDIPNEKYERLPYIDQFSLREYIENGTILPKGHGRLGDLDKIWNKLKELEEYYQAEFLKESNAIHESAMNGRLYGFTNSKFIVQDAETIIEANKE
jgi:hypothetical protein